jgi:uncharacterized protein YdaU (DUF1376 family)
MSLPYFPLYAVDHEAETAHLSLEEVGAHDRLWRLCWMTPGCSIPDDPAWIARRLRVDAETYDRVVAVVIAEFFKRRRRRLYSPRLLEEFQKAAAARNGRSKAGKEGVLARKRLKDKQKSLSNAKAGLSDTRALPEPEPERKKESAIALSKESAGPDPEGFGAFWETYPHRGGAKKGKVPARRSYASALRAGAAPADILAGAERYRSDRQALTGYAKDPATWLNQKGWTDDVEPTPAQIIPITGGRNGTSQHRGSAAFDVAHREYARRIAAGEVDRGPDPSDPFAGR